MNDRELESFEAEMQRLRPAEAPPGLSEKILRSVRCPQPAPATTSPPAGREPRFGWQVLRWLVPAGAAAAVAFFVISEPRPQPSKPSPIFQAAKGPASSSPEEMEVDRSLVATFEAVATMPGGKPVRFLCQEWQDKTTYRDGSRGLAIERSAPRLEIVPMRYEVY